METLEEELDESQKKMMELKLENNILQIEFGKRDMLDQPHVVINPSRLTIEQSTKRDQSSLQRISEHEYDDEL